MLYPVIESAEITAKVIFEMTCNNSFAMKTLRIGITACSKTEQYQRWMESAERFGITVICEILSGEPTEATLKILDRLDGIVFSGGGDFDPERLNIVLSEEEQQKLNISFVQPERDALEWALAEKSIDRNLPILGICRGEQLVSTVLGGTLFLDIETEVPEALPHRDISTRESGYHSITLDRTSVLYRIIGAETGMVSTRHHQAVKTVGEGLRAVGFSEDGIIEAIESSDPDKIILLVQWHPERMWIESSELQRPELDNAFSDKLLEGFLKIADSHRTKQKR